MNNIMIDIETLGTAADAVILSIGAVRFDPHAVKDPEVTDCFYALVDLDQPDRTVTDSTFRWWLGQDEEARFPLTSKQNVVSPELLPLALFRLHTMIAKTTVEGVWGNGADFDNAILQHAWSHTDHKTTPLWPYKANRCFRTFIAMSDPRRECAPQMNTHNALEDALNQARWMQRIFARARGEELCSL